MDLTFSITISIIEFRVMVSKSLNYMQDWSEEIRPNRYTKCYLISKF
jgi:hypothetical protein